jgi:hypothetical protein
MKNSASFILPISIGRTGSTLLMGLLNSFSGVLVRGENNLFCYDLMKSVAQLEGSLEQSGGQSTDPWFGTEEIDIDRYITNLRQSVVRELEGSRNMAHELKWIGYKEIRYFDLGEDDLFKFIVFLDRFFPNVHFIHHTRDYSEISNSGWWGNYRPDLLIPKFRDFDLRVSDILNSCFRERTFNSRYEDIVNDANGFYQNLARFLDLEPEEGAADFVMKMTHSSVTTDVLNLVDRTVKP